MKYIRTKDLEIGMINARQIYDKNANLKINAGVALKDYYISYLIDNKIKGVYISDNLTNGIIVENPIPEDLKNDVIKKMENLKKSYIDYGKSKANEESEISIKNKQKVVNDNIDNVINVSRKIANDIYTNNSVCFDLFDLQGEGNNVITNSIAIAELSVLVCKNLNFTLSECELIAEAAILGDIGKFIESDAIIMKGINFSDNVINTMGVRPEKNLKEYSEDYHSLYSYFMLISNNRISSELRNIIIFHSELENREGPFRKQPYSKYSKIIGIATAYVDIIAGLEGKKFACPKEARAKLMTYYGGKFDKTYIEYFLNYISPYPKGTTVRLSNNLEGIVMENRKATLIDRPCLILVEPNDEHSKETYKQCLNNEQNAAFNEFLSTLNPTPYRKYFNNNDSDFLDDYCISGNKEKFEEWIKTKDKLSLIKYHESCNKEILKKIMLAPKINILDLAQSRNFNIVIDDSLILDIDEPLYTNDDQNLEGPVR